jgi:hypothetical protein
MKKTTAYGITFNGSLNKQYIRQTKKEAIQAFRLDDPDRMSWNYHQKENKAKCIKLLIEY